MSARPFLSLVFPIFDEERNIEALVGAALRTGERVAHDFEVVLVDDGSRDASREIIELLCEQDFRVRAIHHAENIGYGAALRSGLREARGEFVFFSDADLQFELADLDVLLEHAKRFDIVAGYRSPRRDPWLRRLIAWVWGQGVRVLFGLDVRDIDCAFKVFRREVIEALPISSVGAFINTEVLVRARAAGFQIHQVPVTHRRRRYGRQTGARPRVIARAIFELAMLYRELRAMAR
jgi:glycosyltransferase involved in cell wall biosynthesis